MNEKASNSYISNLMTKKFRFLENQLKNTVHGYAKISQKIVSYCVEYLRRVFGRYPAMLGESSIVLVVKYTSQVVKVRF